MSAARDALESAQARLKELEQNPISEDQLLLLADALEKEAQAYEQVLEKGERRALARENTDPTARLMTFGFGFALLFATPAVAMIGVSLARQLKHQPEVSWAALLVGSLLIMATLSSRARRAVAHLASREWRFIAKARRTAASLRQL